MEVLEHDSEEATFALHKFVTQHYNIWKHYFVLSTTSIIIELTTTIYLQLWLMC